MTGKLTQNATWSHGSSNSDTADPESASKLELKILKLNNCKSSIAQLSNSHFGESPSSGAHDHPLEQPVAQVTHR